MQIGVRVCNLNLAKSCLGYPRQLQSVEKAMLRLLEGNDFEDVIRTAVSLGGDCDTLTCIAGSIEEAYYEISDYWIDECLIRLPEDMKAVLKTFDEMKIV